MVPRGAHWPIPQNGTFSSFDAEGHLIVSLEGSRRDARKARLTVRLSAAARRVADLLYRIDWQPCIAAMKSGVKLPVPSTWLLLGTIPTSSGELGHRACAVPDGARRCRCTDRIRRRKHLQWTHQPDLDNLASDARWIVAAREFRSAALSICSMRGQGPPMRGIVHLWSAVMPEATWRKIRLERAENVRQSACCISRRRWRRERATKLRAWVLDRVARRLVELGETSWHPEQAPLWGMHRGLMLEAPELRIACIDVDPETATSTGSGADGRTGCAAPGEAQVAYRVNDLGTDARLVALAACAAPEAVPATIDGPFRLQLKEYGSADNLQLTPISRRKPDRNQVEIAVTATALNFRDVVIALGMLKDFYAKEMGIARASDIWLGFDCAGVISAVGEGVTDLAVGDLVMSPAVGGAASHIIAFPARRVMQHPQRHGSYHDGRVAA